MKTNFTISISKLALTLLFGGWLLHTNNASAQRKNQKPVYTCRLPLYDRPYTCCLKSTHACELPVRGEVKQIPPAKDTATAQKDSAVAPLPVSKCSKSDILTQTETSKQIPKTIIENTVQIQNHLVADSIVMLEDIIEEVPYVEMVQEFPIRCMLINPYPEEVFVIDSSLIIDGEFEAKGTEDVVIPNQLFSAEEEKNSVASEDALNVSMDCYPNPSRGTMIIKYSSKNHVPESVVLFDLNGNKVRTLIENQSAADSSYLYKFDISDLADGIYFCEMKTGDSTITKKIILEK